MEQDYKKKFVAILEKRKELQRKREELCKSIHLLDGNIRDTDIELDNIFAEMQEKDNALYDKFSKKESYEAIVRFEHKGYLVEIRRYELNKKNERVSIYYRPIL